MSGLQTSSWDKRHNTSLLVNAQLNGTDTWQITSKIRSSRRIGMRCETKQASLFRGLIFAMLAGAFSTVVFVIVKQIKNLHPGQLAL
ncbi:hypothetical protein AVEN_82644-1 [Araneus ventricosus]|uniref:Uncharacterized protein n=1 Tax=Araneus ventricosus TaxID=182803 RepID=A0A4Y2R2I4_ARAVE|nr:hypothetical protein AVEN_82644-1 [Araneus ventricosus]